MVDRLSGRQRELLVEWLPGAEVVRDHSWELVGTTLVIEVVQDGSRYIVKAGDEENHHLVRELKAHRNWLEPWTSAGRAPLLVHADEDARLIVTRYLPGELVQGSEFEYRPEIYRQAGWLLAQLHGQLAVEDEAYEVREKERTLRYLAEPHRIAPDLAARLQEIVESWPTATSFLVPTHGDWQPRNWLIHKETVSVIDFGRAALRPAMTDFARLAAQQFGHDPALEVAFLDGYGSDPREPASWHRNRLREAIATAVWAYRVGDEAFEKQGHRMIAEVDLE